MIKQCLEVVSRAQQMEPKHYISQPECSIVPPLERGEHTPLCLGWRQGLCDVALENGVGADLDKNPTTCLSSRIYRLRELHRLAYITPPVAGIQRLAIQLVAGNGRYEHTLCR